MNKHDRKMFETLPPRPDLLSIEPTLESLSDLAARRDVLRSIAERASIEADKLTKEVDQLIAAHLRSLRALAAQLDERTN